MYLECRGGVAGRQEAETAGGEAVMRPRPDTPGRRARRGAARRRAGRGVARGARGAACRRVGRGVGRGSTRGARYGAWRGAVGRSAGARGGLAYRRGARGWTGWPRLELLGAGQRGATTSRASIGRRRRQRRERERERKEERKKTNPPVRPERRQDI